MNSARAFKGTFFISLKEFNFSEANRFWPSFVFLLLKKIRVPAGERLDFENGRKRKERK
jgi:hypothetical protein